MSEKAYKLYQESFYKFLNQKLNPNNWDSKLESANLYFGESNAITINLDSKYFSVLNKFYLDNLEATDLSILESKQEIDEEVLSIVSRTYKDTLKKQGVTGIMYDPAYLGHYSKNGNLVLELVYGKNTAKVSDEQYVELYKKQQDFIHSLIEGIKKEVLDKLDINCEVFVDKRVKTNGRI